MESSIKKLCYATQIKCPINYTQTQLIMNILYKNRY